MDFTQRTCSPVFFIRIESVPLVCWSDFSCHYNKMVTQFFSACMIHSRKLHFTFLFYFFKAYLSFLQGTVTQTNKMPLAIYIDFPKFSFNFTLRRKYLLNLSSATLRSDWNMSRVVCQPTKQRKKCWNCWNWTMWDWDTSKWMLWWVSSWQKKVAKRRWKGGKRVVKKVAKWWRKVGKVAMIINLATDKSWLASKTTYNVIHHQIFSLFCTFLTKYKWKKKNLTKSA